MSTVLIIDDEEGIRESLTDILSDEGFRTVLAGSAEDGLRLIDEEQPDLIFLDVWLPGMDGIEALGKILAKDKAMPVILNTAYSTYKDNFMTWSADAYVVKSGDLSELRANIKDVLKTRGVTA